MIEVNIPLRALAAIQNGELHSLENWLQEGGDMYSTEPNGEGLMHKAAFYGQIEIIAYLKNQGLHIDSTDKQGFTPLHEAARAGQTKMVEWLLKNGAYPAALNSSSRTALDMAVENAKSDETAALLRSVKAETSWKLTGDDEIVAVTPKPLIRHTLTEIFNFTANTYILINVNDVTKMESTVFRTFSDFTDREPLEAAELAFRNLGGVFPEGYDPSDMVKKKMPKPKPAGG